jgi:hypothetical protein
MLDVSDSRSANWSVEELQRQPAFALPFERQCVRFGRALAFYSVTDDWERRELDPDQLSSLPFIACMDLCKTLAHSWWQSRSLLESSIDQVNRRSTVEAWPEFERALTSDEFPPRCLAASRSSKSAENFQAGWAMTSPHFGSAGGGGSGSGGFSPNNGSSEDARPYLWHDIVVPGPGPLVPAVPEASTWTMMLLGLAGLGFMGYRRKAAFRLM